MELTPALRQKLQNPLWAMMGSMAVNPKLSSLLLFDMQPFDLEQTAETFQKLLRVTKADQDIKIVRLSSFDTEETLWGQLGLAQIAEQTSIQWQSGLLGQSQSNVDTPKIVLIPDLTMLSLSATRACVMAMGADVVHLERNGEQQFWQPNLYWIIGCPSKSEEVGKVSPHLMDRIPLRLGVKTSEQTDRVSRIKMLELLLAAEKLSESGIQVPELEPELETWFRHIPEIAKPSVMDAAWQRILAYTSLDSDTDTLYHRRELTLMRLAIAHGQLLGEETISAETVDRVAGMMGLDELVVDDRPVEEPPKSKKSDDITPSQEEETSKSMGGDRPDPVVPITKPPILEPPKEPVYQSSDEKTEEEIPLPTVEAVGEAYAEDKIINPNREVHSLRLPIRQFKSKTVARGIIIGTERTYHPQDLAIVRTVLEAAKFRQFRENIIPDYGDRLRIFPTDLFAYRRAPVAEQMLMIVLDYTCLDYCKWEDKLYPYISWAYTQRATVGLVQVGVKTENDGELRAKKLLAKSVLVPSFESGLNLEKVQTTKATPLAHGLDLALAMLRHSLQHGSNTISKAVCLVVSDGRGNIPLAASQQGKITFPVAQKGIQDALKVAGKIGKLDKVESIWLNPQPKQCKNLPLKMAVAMKAKVVAIPPVETWEVKQ